VKYDIITNLQFQKFNSRIETPYGLLSGLRDATLDAHFDDMRNALVAQLNARVLTEPAGDEVVATTAVNVPLRPRWIPKFLWRRLSCRVIRTTATAQPLWAYPSASVGVPALGRPVRMETRSLDVLWEDR
jgi:hypothetical protein